MASKIRNIKPLAETKFLSLYDTEYENKKGNIKHWMIASRKSKETLRGQIFGGNEEKIDAVIIAALHRASSKLVIIRQFRIPVNDYIYELPAGLIDGDESILTATKRELFEETGLILLSIDDSKSLRPIHISAGMTDESIAMVYCECDGEPSIEHLEEDEDLEVILVSQEEAKELLNKNVKIDIKAYLVMQHFAALGKI